MDPGSPSEHVVFYHLGHVAAKLRGSCFFNSGWSPEIINGDFKRRVFTQEEAAKKEKRFLTGRQVAWMIDEYFKVSDADEPVLDLNDFLRVELKNDNLQSFNVRWTKPLSR